MKMKFKVDQLWSVLSITFQIKVVQNFYSLSKHHEAAKSKDSPLTTIRCYITLFLKLNGVVSVDHTKALVMWATALLLFSIIPFFHLWYGGRELNL